MNRVSSLEARARTSGRHLAAYEFVLDGLQTATVQIHREAPAGDDERHITASQLLDGLAEHAVDRFGLLAPLVFQEWGVRGSEDIGAMVWEMIELGYMRSSEEDTLEDFLQGPDFNDRLQTAAGRVFDDGRRLEE